MLNAISAKLIQRLICTTCLLTPRCWRPMRALSPEVAFRQSRCNTEQRHPATPAWHASVMEGHLQSGRGSFDWKWRPQQACTAYPNSDCLAALQGPKMVASREGACTRDHAEAAFGEVLQRLQHLGPHIHHWAMPLEHLVLRLEELAVGRWPPPAENRPGVAQHAAVVDSLVAVSGGVDRVGRCANEVSGGQEHGTPSCVCQPCACEDVVVLPPPVRSQSQVLQHAAAVVALVSP